MKTILIATIFLSLGIHAEDKGPIELTPKVLPKGKTLETAYQREYAFLISQKNDLEKRLSAIDAEYSQKIKRAKKDLATLEKTLIGKTVGNEKLTNRLFEAERTLESAQNDDELLKNTLNQGENTLHALNIEFKAENDQIALNDQLTLLFDKGILALDQSSRITKKDAEFYGIDGKKVSGTVYSLGLIALYGISDAVSGPLYPIGNGKLRVWKDQDAATKGIFDGSSQPDTLHLFIKEFGTKSVEEKKEKTLGDIMKAGGTIGWVIVFLGFFSLLFSAIRAILLSKAGKNEKEIEEGILPLVESGNLTEAKEQVLKATGPLGRIVQWTLLHLDFDKERLEDAIMEKMIEESALVDRFGTAILVIAAVAPLLGLLGTVTGMISTFDIITEYGTGDPKLLSTGISEALVTTELGLVVAIPSLLLGNILSGQSEKIKSKMEQVALRISNRFQRYQKGLEA